MTRILLDTHALLWFVANDPALPASARSLIAQAVTEGLLLVTKESFAAYNVATAW